ncbi:MAG TPA: type II toxin-antitoxin system Phd/YefM family antitoxin [Streptosporangiaceae bacterium]|jgi:antitoxin YefM|nr:type II toxin-antitoxin system Phd/YefM family antitoxin [Streptosporangiaceae bacterium]
MAITATEARKKLFPLIKQVNDDRVPAEIISDHGRAYPVAADDHESMAETGYLPRSPANAARLMTAADEVRRGRTSITKTMEELGALADEDRPPCGRRLPPARRGRLQLLGDSRQENAAPPAATDRGSPAHSIRGHRKA